MEVYYSLQNQKRVQRLTRYSTHCQVLLQLPPGKSARPPLDGSALPYGGDAQAATQARDRQALRAIFEARALHEARSRPAPTAKAHWTRVQSVTLVPGDVLKIRGDGW